VRGLAGGLDTLGRVVLQFTHEESLRVLPRPNKERRNIEER
jgi:hypothetical protein